jgi:hypothetical protein
MTGPSDDAKARAEARFNRELQRSRHDDALKAEIAAQARTVEKKTERLRALRVAKEADEAATKPARRMAVTLAKTRGSPRRRAREAVISDTMMMTTAVMVLRLRLA